MCIKRDFAELDATEVVEDEIRVIVFFFYYKLEMRKTEGFI